MPDSFYVSLFRPFAAVVVMFVAFYIGKWIARFIPEGRIKRILTKPRSNRSEFLERMDARMFAAIRSLVRKVHPKQAAKRRR
jgi:hypothetical protein